MSLIDFLSELSQSHENAIPFETFMREALYHPEFGYYTTNIDTVGGRGADFSTSATLIPELGSAIAGWVTEELHYFGGRRTVTDAMPALIEIGAGDGSLFFNVLKHLRHRARRSLDLHIVEISPRLEALQRRKLAKLKSLTWHRDIDSALEACNGRALIFSNELVDAFPAVALRRNGDAWEEVCLSFDRDSGLKEVFTPLGGKRSVVSDLSVSDSSVSDSTSLHGPHPDGQRIEIHASYRDWLHHWLPKLQSGSLLTIDYGDTADRLYHRRPNGTLRAYWKHQRFEGPPEIYARFGRQDLTADVNFSDLLQWGDALGLDGDGGSFEFQDEFIRRFSGGGKARPGPAADAANEAFKVLHQRKVPTVA